MPQTEADERKQSSAEYEGEEQAVRSACANTRAQFLGQQNITNAYVSGMKEDLNAHGNELNYFVVACKCYISPTKKLRPLTVQTTPHMSSGRSHS